MEDREILESTLSRARQALAVLEGQAAGYTVLTIPAHLVIELDEKSKEVARLEARLAQIETGAVAALHLPYNLSRRSEFVGREAYKVQVHAALRSRAYLVSIEGIGGIGKTSLALEVAYECWQASAGQVLRDDVATFDGFIWVTAQGRALTLNEVLDAVARTLDYPGIAQKPLEEKRPAVCRLLQAGRYLLVVDNYETITDKAISEFLIELPEPTKALITTREQNLSRVSAIALKGLEEAEALELLRGEGRRLGMTALVQAEDAVLLRLYKATGGAPLALKWAVGQIKQKGQSLDTVLDALYGARGDIFDHTFARSWQLLSTDAQLALCVMPLFVHSASREALEAASELHHFALDEALGQLVEMSLVNATDELDVTRRRYSIHPLTRAFAGARLREDGSHETVLMLRVADYYRRRCAELGIWGNVSGFSWFEMELPNLFSVIEWAYAVQKWNLVTSIFKDFYHFLGTCAYWQERIRYGELALDAARQANDLSAQAMCWDALGWIFNRQGRFAEAEQRLNLALESYASLENDEGIARMLIALAKLAIASGDLPQAQRIVDELPNRVSENVYQDVIDAFWTVRGHIEWHSGNLKRARELLLQALEKTRQKHAYGLSISSRLIDLGNVSLDLHDTDEALQFFQDGLKSAEQHLRQDNIAKAKFGLARVALLRGQYEEARSLAQEAREMFIRLEAQHQLAEVNRFLDELHQD